MIGSKRKAPFFHNDIDDTFAEELKRVTVLVAVQQRHEGKDRVEQRVEVLELLEGLDLEAHLGEPGGETHAR